jgi:hypothetical protein
MPYKDPTKQRAAVEKVRQRNLEFVRKAKAKPCVDCGIQYPYYVMQFDHVRGKKQHGMTAFRNRLHSLATIEKEIAKCEVVCANCHAVRTWKRIHFLLDERMDARSPSNADRVGSNPTKETIFASLAQHRALGF